METKTVNIEDRGNGLPANGELIGRWGAWGEPEVYRVVEGGRIWTYPGTGGGDIAVGVTVEVLDIDDVAAEIDFKSDDLGLRCVGIVGFGEVKTEEETEK